MVNRGAAGVWEKWTVQDLNAGSLFDGDQITFRSDNGFYVTSTAEVLSATKTLTTLSEVFTLHQVDGSGEIFSGQRVYLTTSDGLVLQAQYGGGQGVVSFSGPVGAWETFVFEIH